jgi:hypothetical protein
MKTEQIIAIVAPAAFNGVVVSVLGLYLKARFDAIDQKFDKLVGQALPPARRR